MFALTKHEGLGQNQEVGTRSARIWRSLSLTYSIIRVNYAFSVPRLNRGSEFTNSFYLAQILYRNLPEDIIESESDSVAVFRLLIT